MALPGFFCPVHGAVLGGCDAAPSCRGAVVAGRWRERGPATLGSFELDLLVEAPRGWLVAGPGRRRTAGDRVRFAPVASVADVGLVAGVFAQRAINIAGVHVELLAAPGHLDNGDLAVAGPLAARLGELFDRLTGLGLAYPYAGLTLVEVPMRLRTYGDGWCNDQRGPSGDLPLARSPLDDAPVLGALWRARPPPKEHALAVEHYFTAYTWASGNNPVVGLARQAFAQQTAADGPSALVLGFVLNDLAAQLLAPNLVADRFSALETDAAVAQHRQELTRLISATWGGRSVFGGELGGVLAAGITWPVWGPQRHPLRSRARGGRRVARGAGRVDGVGTPAPRRPCIGVCAVVTPRRQRSWPATAHVRQWRRPAGWSPRCI